MWWSKPKKPTHGVCHKCSVHFEPATNEDPRWANYCTTCRKPIRERDMMRDSVLAWADRNWERLYQTMVEELQAEQQRQKQMSDTAREAVQRAQAQNQTMAHGCNTYNAGLNVGIFGTKGFP